MKDRRQALLVLEDGTLYPGYAFAGSGEVLGEVVFNTGMAGYQEVLTDPSYKGQIVTMTYPLIGNYGINGEDMESAGIYLEGFIVREYQDHPSNWRSRKTLKAFLESYGKLGVEGIDTRALTRRIRVSGAMRGIISTETRDTDLLLQKVRTYPGLVGQDLIKKVTCKQPYQWKNGSVQSMPSPEALSGNSGSAGSREPSKKLRVIVIDCGVKYSILRHLERLNCDVLVLPATASAREVMAYRPDGALFSNGPGDPAVLPYIVETARELLGEIPVFGICLGHQILGQALGGRTTKLKFGHHGVNQPVKNRQTGRIEITSQNHGFVVMPETLPKEIDATYDNLNDHTSEGISSKAEEKGFKKAPYFSVQYHPEAAPGPHDVAYLFEKFVSLMNMPKE
jgi:carbamoyl-phosphate synthase small subunit